MDILVGTIAILAVISGLLYISLLVLKCFLPPQCPFCKIEMQFRGRTGWPEEVTTYLCPKCDRVTIK